MGGTPLFVVVVVCNASKRDTFQAKFVKLDQWWNEKLFFLQLLRRATTVRRLGRSFLRGEAGGNGLGCGRDEGSLMEEGEMRVREKHRKASSCCFFFPSLSVSLSAFHAFPQGAHLQNTHTFSSAFQTPIRLEEKYP